MKYKLLINGDEKGWAKLSETRQQQAREIHAVHGAVGRAVCGQFSVAPNVGSHRCHGTKRQTARDCWAIRRDARETAGPLHH